MAFTKEQQLAIDTDGKNIIVSAGAGSGKTAVLTERVIRKLKDGVDVDHLLVLTFTNEAASEMKIRIRKAIIKNNLAKQLDLLNSAYITTFDSFALALVKKYHYLLDISGNIKIASGGLITLYKYKAIDSIFDSMYGNEKFDKLIGDFCLKDDTLVKKFILDLYDKLDLMTDKYGYLDTYISRYYTNEYLEHVTDLYIKLIKRKISELNETYNAFLSFASDKLIASLDSYFKPLFSGKNYDDYCLFKSMTSPRFIGVSEDGLRLKDELKNLISEILKLLRFDNIEAIDDAIMATSDYASVIIDIIYQLDNLVTNYKTSHEIYEFNDISHMAIRLVRDNLDVREELKNYFNEIMVDEYQDTSDIQEEFINYIANDNVYMVGDIKQSIYRFRNANPYIFRNKYNSYSNNQGGVKIDLLKNFRSRSETLYNINEIFNLIMDDRIGDANYLASHNMEYGNTLYDNEDTLHDNYLEIYNYEITSDDEYTKEEKELFIIAEDIADKINHKYQVFDKETSQLRSLRYSDICIITDRNKYLTNYKKILEYKGIPSVIYMDQELINNVVVLVIKNLIKLIYYVNNNIYDDKFRYVYASVMRSFIFNYDDNTIFNNLNSKKYLDNEIIKLCLEIDLDVPIADFLNSVIDKFKIYDALTNLALVDENIICIENLIEIARDASDILYGIKDFIDYLDDAEAASLGIKYAVGASSGDAVKIMNIHKSKGLEFSLCYFTGMHNKFAISDISSKLLYSKEFGIILPYISSGEVSNTILKDLFVDDYFIKEISEKIRLLYVALTRCREKMIIVTSIDSDDGYLHLVPDNIRLKYRSFLDILKSLKIIRKYLVNKTASYDKNYKKITIKDVKKSNTKDLIIDERLDINYDKLNISNFAKKTNQVFDIDTIKKMEYGTRIHEIFEYDDFFNPTSIYVKKFLSHIPPDFINIYHEYEFEYTFTNQQFHGIIDLLVEYDDCFYIIDYKLKDTSDTEYIKQLKGYYEYLVGYVKKDIKMFLYSVTMDKLTEVK